MLREIVPKVRRLGRGGPALLEAIYVAPEAGSPMERRSGTEVGAGGLAGDRYAAGQGYWRATDAWYEDMNAIVCNMRDLGTFSGPLTEPAWEENLELITDFGHLPSEI